MAAKEGFRLNGAHAVSILGGAQGGVVAPRGGSAQGVPAAAD